MSGIDLPKYVVLDKDRHGNSRYYYRRPGEKKVRIRSEPGHSDFLEKCRIAAEGSSPKAKAAVGEVPCAPQYPSGTFGALALDYLRGLHFRDLAIATQRRRRRMLESFVQKHGMKRVSALDKAHIFRMMNELSVKPEAANDFLKMMRRVLDFAVSAGYIKTNPAEQIKTVRSNSEGFYAWSEDDISKFEAFHPLGTKAHLALYLLLYTAQRRSDVVRMGPSCVSDGTIHIRQDKTSTIVEFPMHPDLAEAIDSAFSGGETFIETEAGKPFSPNGFGNWFRKRCDEAGMPRECSAHGLRKAASRRLAEAGCTPHEIMSITGHKTLREVSRYTASVERRTLAKKASNHLGKSTSASASYFVYIYRHENRVIYIGQGVASRPLAHLGRSDFPSPEDLRIEIIPVANKDAALALEQNLISAHDGGQLLNRIMYRYSDASPKIIEHVA